MWTISRQAYWGVDEDKKYVVEIAEGGIDYINPDALAPKYSGEFESYDDPRKAVEVAIDIAEQWRKDSKDIKVHIAFGCTHGFFLPFEPKSRQELIEFAEKTYQNLPKCATCGRIVEDENNYQDILTGEYITACSDYCADRYVEKHCQEV